MLKNTIAEKSFRERKASFSNRILANGRMDVMPKEGIEAELESGSLKESLETLFQQRARLQKEMIQYREGSPEWNRLRDTLNRVKGQLGHTEKMLREAKEKHFAVLFQFCAEQLLTHKAYIMIREMTHQLMGKPYQVNNSD